jgi:glycosyltransferase involved in cell wall biosynthesis
MNIPTISVIIPCYNSENFVAETVHSALQQTHPTKEIICVNDGSSDGTLDVLRSIANEAEEGLHIQDQENQGICAARNVGLEEASGEYIAFLDHDDILHPEKLEHQAQLIAGATFRPDFVAASYKEVFPDDERGPTTRHVYTTDPWIGLIHARLGRTSSNLWRADAVREVGEWQEGDGLSLDTGLMFRMLQSDGRVLTDSRPLTTRYTMNVSASRKNREKQSRTFLEMRTRIYDYLQAHGELTKRRKEALHVDMITAVRGLYTCDPTQAVEKHNEVIRPRFDTPDTSFGPGRLYRALYRILGFEHAEQLYPAWLRAREGVSKWVEGSRHRP